MLKLDEKSTDYDIVCRYINEAIINLEIPSSPLSMQQSLKCQDCGVTLRKPFKLLGSSSNREEIKFLKIIIPLFLCETCYRYLFHLASPFFSVGFAVLGDVFYEYKPFQYTNTSFSAPTKSNASGLHPSLPNLHKKKLLLKSSDTVGEECSSMSQSHLSTTSASDQHVKLQSINKVPSESGSSQADASVPSPFSSSSKLMGIHHSRQIHPYAPETASEPTSSTKSMSSESLCIYTSFSMIQLAAAPVNVHIPTRKKLITIPNRSSPSSSSLSSNPSPPSLSKNLPSSSPSKVSKSFLAYVAPSLNDIKSTNRKEILVHSDGFTIVNLITRQKETYSFHSVHSTLVTKHGYRFALGLYVEKDQSAIPSSTPDFYLVFDIYDRAKEIYAAINKY